MASKAVSRKTAADSPSTARRYDPATSALRNLICSTIPGEPVGLIRDLKPEERATIERRIQVIDEAISDRDERLLKLSVTAMLAAFPGSVNSTDEAKSVVAVYMETLIDLPTWAVDETLREMRAGKIADVRPEFRPTTAQIYQHVQKLCVDPLLAEAAELSQVLGGRAMAADPLGR